MASPQRTASPPLRLVQDGDARAYDWEQLPLPAQRLVLVSPLAFGWSAAGAILAVLLGGGVARRVRQCSAHGPWVCCASHRRRFRETYGCRDCRADLLSWRPVAPAPVVPEVTPAAPGPEQATPDEEIGPAAPRAIARKTALSSRPRSIGNAPLTRKERKALAAARVELAGVYRRRPKTYGDCLKRQGPCGFISCRHNLFLEVDYRVSPPTVKLNFPGMEIDEPEETCSLKVADQREAGPGVARPEALDSICTGDGHTQERVGALLNITDGWVQHFEVEGLAKIRAALDRGTDEDDEVGDPPDHEGGE